MDCHCTDDKKLKDNKTEGVHRMKIVRVNTYTVRPRWGFVEIITDDGLTGWGEPVLEGHCEAGSGVRGGDEALFDRRESGQN